MEWWFTLSTMKLKTRFENMKWSHEQIWEHVMEMEDDEKKKKALYGSYSNFQMF